MELCESCISILSLLPAGHRTVLLVGYPWRSRPTRLRVILPCSLRLYHACGTHASAFRYLSSRFNYRHSLHNVSTVQSRSLEAHGLFSYTVILLMRTYAFSGRKKKVLAMLSITFLGLVGIIIWVISKELTRLL